MHSFLIHDIHVYILFDTLTIHLHIKITPAMFNLMQNSKIFLPQQQQTDTIFFNGLDLNFNVTDAILIPLPYDE
jgi:hypothetical protein